jgi:hypothetical protein
MPDFLGGSKLSDHTAVAPRTRMQRPSAPLQKTSFALKGWTPGSDQDVINLKGSLSSCCATGKVDIPAPYCCTLEAIERKTVDMAMRMNHSSAPAKMAGEDGDPSR